MEHLIYFLMAGMSFMLVAAFTYLIDVNGIKKFKMSQVLVQIQYLHMYFQVL